MRFSYVTSARTTTRRRLYYRKALELDPNHANINGNYAIFLQTIRKDYDQAEIYYRKALELDPNDANINGNYALFLNNIRKDYDQAEIYYRKALELDPNHTNNNGNYAGFLLAQGKQESASPYLEKALQGEKEDVVIGVLVLSLGPLPRMA